MTKLVHLALLIVCGNFAWAQQPDSGNIKKKDTASGEVTQVTVAANAELKESGSSRFFIGKNYRPEWTTPITANVFQWNGAGGKIHPTKEGGGKQTKSLRIEDKNGREWSLRSVRKYPEKALPEELRGTLAEKIVTDAISASYPYGVLSVAVLSKAANVPYLPTRLIYINDDPALGEFRDKYKNTLALLEDREPEGEKGAKDKSIGTEELVYKLAKEPHNLIDQQAVLKARILDNFIMDFDRHEGQWNWRSRDSGDFKIYYPVPKDRDQAFFTNQGFLTHLASGKERFPELEGFKVKTKRIELFNRAARNFDHTFLSGLTKDDWSAAVDQFLNSMTDEVIDQAFRQQPEEIRNFSAPSMAVILKEKRKIFKKQILSYYASLSKQVDVAGTNDEDEFKLTANEDGTVTVIVNSKDKGRSFETFRRVFDPKETKEIRLYALEGKDHFKLEGKKFKIKVRMVGGPGEDKFSHEGKSKNLFVYDVNFEDNTVDKGFHNKINNDPLNNEYRRLNHEYNFVSPGPGIEISPYEGILLGIKLSITTRGFRKEPLSSRQTLSATHALGSSTKHFRYDADFFKVMRHTDLLVRSDAVIPTNRTNYFGLGNETTIDESLEELDYYHIRYDIANAAVLLRHSLTHRFWLAYGPSFQYLHLRDKENKGHYISDHFDPSIPVSERYANKYYGGGEIRFGIDTRNHPVIPTRGVNLVGYGQVLRGLNSNSNNLEKLGGNFSFYSDLGTKGRFVFASIIGGGHVFGKFEVEQAQYLGFTEHLRGYRSNRFSGRSDAYNNTELRVKLFNWKKFLVPTTVGIYGFNDLGRVWGDGEESKIWHHGYGGGVYLSPLNQVVVTGYLSFSKEEKALPWVTIGFVF